MNIRGCPPLEFQFRQALGICISREGGAVNRINETAFVISCRSMNLQDYLSYRILDPQMPEHLKLRSSRVEPTAFTSCSKNTFFPSPRLSTFGCIGTWFGLVTNTSPSSSSSYTRPVHSVRPGSASSSTTSEPLLRCAIGSVETSIGACWCIGGSFIRNLGLDSWQRCS